jgi:hypothetical protein
MLKLVTDWDRRYLQDVRIPNYGGILPIAHIARIVSDRYLVILLENQYFCHIAESHVHHERIQHCISNSQM